MLRDIWAWLTLLPIVALIWHSRGAPLGEPVAEDFDFLHHAFFGTTHTLLDGGGSTAFWRPVAHQIYYALLGPTMLSHPRWVVTFHFACLALASLLIYRVLRGAAWSGPAAAVAASFPALAESMRALLSWSSYFVDLGLIVFSAIALHEASRRRLWSTLAALLLAFGCKELAIVTALLLPWMPGPHLRSVRERLRWAAATGALAIAWGIAYVTIRRHAHLELPHGLEHNAITVQTPVLTRYVWAKWNSARAAFSLPFAHTSWEPWLVGSLIALGVAAIALFVVRGSSRRMLRARAAWILWGLAWFSCCSATLIVIYPIWAPTRALFGSIGLGIGVVALAEAASPWLLAALFTIRAGAFAMNPAPPPIVTAVAPSTGAFLDFEHLVRLQRLMEAVRTRLKRDYPTMAQGSNLVQQNMPRLAEYAFGKNLALQCWYRDTTLRWQRYDDFIHNPTSTALAVVQYQPDRLPMIALVDPRVMLLIELAKPRAVNEQWTELLAEMKSADSLLTDRDAVYTMSLIENRRAVALSGLGRMPETEQAARAALAHWPQSPSARYWIAYALMGQNRLAEAQAVLDTALAIARGDSVLLELQDTIAVRRRREGK
jgi:Tetratricopeptide repeat